MVWQGKHPQFSPEMLGYLPNMLNEHDPRSAREQLDDNYQHGGGMASVQRAHHDIR